MQTKDLGEVGDMMANLVAELKGFNADPEEKKGLFGFIRKNVDKMTLLKARYDEAEVNVNKIVAGAGEPSGDAAQGHRHARSAL